MVYILVCVPDPKNQMLIEKAKSCSQDQSSIVRQFIHTVSVSIPVKLIAQCKEIINIM